MIIAWSICAVAAFGWGFSHWKDAVIVRSGIKQKVSQWIDALGLTRKILVDEKTHFGFQVSLPPRIIIWKTARLRAKFYSFRDSYRAAIGATTGGLSTE